MNRNKINKSIMSDKYNTETASIKATIGKFRKLDTDKLTIKGQDISELVGSGSVTIKHAQDTRTTVTQNDLWGQWIETLDDGTVIIHDDEVVNPNGSSSAWNDSITKVENNKAYVGEDLFANIQTEKIKNGQYSFYYCKQLASFNSNLSSLTNGYRMFYGDENLTTFTSDLSSLTNSYEMLAECDNLTTFTSNLSSLTNGYRMFYTCIDLTNFASDSSGSPVNLNSLTHGKQMFYKCWKLKSFNSNLNSLTNGNEMFFQCINLTTFNSNLSSLTNGYDMFYNCKQLASFNSNLSSLTYGNEMFSKCHALTTFDSDLSSLISSNNMFVDCDNLTTFTSDLSSLTDGGSMFYYCEKLTTFTSDLSSLTDGEGMFNECSNLTTFTSDLSSLIYGGSMFNKTKLTPKSVLYIVGSINDIVAEKLLYTSGTIPYVTLSNSVPSAPRGFMSDGKYAYTYLKAPWNSQTHSSDNDNPQPYTATISASYIGKLTIGIGVTNDADTIEQQLEDFAKEAYYDSWADLKQAFVDKGWTVTWQYGGTTTSITYDLRGDRAIPCPIYAQLIEEEDKERAEYCSEDGTKFYNIEWGHDVTHPEEFQQFDSLETACVTYGVMPKEYLETNGQPTLF